MLVLTRKQQEKIYIGDQVTITIVRIQGNTVRVGIEAPQNVRVMRGELSPSEKVESSGIASGVAAEATDDQNRTGVYQDAPECPASRGALAGRVRLQAARRPKRRAEPAPLNAI